MAHPVGIDVIDRRLAGHRLEEPAELAFAHRDELCQLLNADRLAVMLLDMLDDFFEPADFGGVGVVRTAAVGGPLFGSQIGEHHQQRGLHEHFAARLLLRIGFHHDVQKPEQLPLPWGIRRQHTREGLASLQERDDHLLLDRIILGALQKIGMEDERAEPARFIIQRVG
ncbi:hypothetical protein D3C81_780820 [compost metagenome]